MFNVRELSGALGDLGTLLPLTLGAVSVAGLAPTPVLAGFGLFYVATAIIYRLPIPVQPMKVVAAVLLTTEITQAGLAAAVTAAVTVWADPFWGLLAGTCAELVRLVLVRALMRRAQG